MALSFIIRRASSPVLPLAIRAVGSPRTFHKAVRSAIADILNSSELHKDSKDNIQVVKKLADDNLLRVIDTKIKSKEHIESAPMLSSGTDPETYEQYKIPKKFPFDVKDNYSENGTIELKREYFNELIKVEVDLAAANEKDEDESDSDSSSNSDDDKDKGSDSESDSSSDSDSDSDSSSDTDAKSDESSNDSDDRVCIPLSVNVSKGSNSSLELLVNAFPDEISIVRLTLKSKGDADTAGAGFAYATPEFWCLDDTMKDALHTYLEVRGIDVSTANVLHKYWEHKGKHDQSVWLKKVKKFIKK